MPLLIVIRCGILNNNTTEGSKCLLILPEGKNIREASNAKRITPAGQITRSKQRERRKQIENE